MKALITKFVPQTFNDLLALLYFPFILIWIVLIAIIYKYVDINMIEALGLGTATGIILSKFNDIYQFYFRKSKD
jgi:4-hydroxybenzoate polyprenyltransferase